MPNIEVIDYGTRGRNKTVRVPRVETSEYVPRKSKRQKAVERVRRKTENRTHWRQQHVVELNFTKKLLFKALRLLRRNKVAMPDELTRILSQHESAVSARVERRRKMLKQFEVCSA